MTRTEEEDTVCTVAVVVAGAAAAAVRRCCVVITARQRAELQRVHAARATKCCIWADLVQLR